ncbi:beta-lactamase-like protein, partial [Polychytrium aggregatum]|uniref:beta-lactamase-like protein n=1 Tax=Polychytrium aggregatum TaxID=110093 RepID=UPI0022FE4F9E
CPAFKKVIETPFTVDAFCYGKIEGCSAYFLTHFHSDHYTGLGPSFEHGPIYCSSVTGNLVISELRVKPEYVHRLKLNREYDIQGIKVTLIDANHCPGAALILFDIPTTDALDKPDRIKILHTGDFRASPEHIKHPSLRDVRLHAVYLDTTYCAPSHCFPEQSLVVRAISSLARPGRLLVAVGTYLIGKERIFVGIAKAMGSKIYVEPRKHRILSCLEDPELARMLTQDKDEADLHVVSMGQMNRESLRTMLQANPSYTHLVAVRPTGWTFRGKPQPQGADVPFGIQHLQPQRIAHNITLFGIPYSEHSSFLELEAFITQLNGADGGRGAIHRVIPTVNNHNQTAMRQMDAWFSKWLGRS